MMNGSTTVKANVSDRPPQDDSYMSRQKVAGQVSRALMRRLSHKMDDELVKTVADFNQEITLIEQRRNETINELVSQILSRH